jgi:hypothetical protein
MRSNEDKKKFLEALSKAPFILHATKQVGIDKATIYRWRKKDPKFNIAVEDVLNIGRAGLCDIAENQIVKMINQGDFKASKFFLENNDKRYFRPRPTNIFVNSKGSSDLTSEQLDKLNLLLDQ